MDTVINQLTLLTFDNTRLAVPLSEVVTIERTRQLQPDDSMGGILGRVTHGGHGYPVYGFSPAFDLLPRLPDQRLFCVCLKTNEGETRLALACDTTMPIRLEQIELLNALPECMAQADTPLQGLFNHGQRLVLFSTTAALAAYINRMENQHEYAC